MFFLAWLTSWKDVSERLGRFKLQNKNLLSVQQKMSYTQGLSHLSV